MIAVFLENKESCSEKRMASLWLLDEYGIVVIQHTTSQQLIGISLYIATHSYLASYNLTFRGNLSLVLQYSGYGENS